MSPSTASKNAPVRFGLPRALSGRLPPRSCQFVQVTRLLARHSVALPAPQFHRGAEPSLYDRRASTLSAAERQKHEADTTALPWRSTVTTACGPSSISTPMRSHDTSARTDSRGLSPRQAPSSAVGASAQPLNPADHPLPSVLTLLTQRPESPFCPDEHADIIRPDEHEGQRALPVCPQARDPVAPVDPRRRRHRFRMRVPGPEIYRPAARPDEHPAHGPLMPRVAKREGEPRAPVLRHRPRDPLDPDLPPVYGCRSHQHAERFGGVRRHLPMRTPDLRHFIAHVNPPPVSSEALYAVTRHRDRSSRLAAARSATTRRNAGISTSPQETRA